MTTSHLPKSKTTSFGRLVRETSSAMMTVTLSMVNVVLGQEQYISEEKRMKLSDMPIEIVAYIFTYLPAKDLTSVSLVCHHFYEASTLESLWAKRCSADFGLPIKSFSSFSYKEFYMKVLHRYKSLIGIWQAEIPSYGGLLEVKVENCCLEGTQLFPPQDPYITRPLRKKALFSIGLGQDNEAVVSCTACEDIHKAEIEVYQGKEFQFRCTNVENHKSRNGRRQALIDWLVEETADAVDLPQFPRSQELLLMKYLILDQYKFNCKFRQLDVPTLETSVPIQPGFFKGTYGAHGLEVILLKYEDGGTKAAASKISGDPNVPAGQTTFQVELCYPMVLTSDQQQEMAQLDELQVIRMTPSSSLNLPAQPFHLPVDCYERFREIPRTCKLRYHAMGQIAGHGFTNPSFSRGHWIIFTEDLFGFLWLDLLSLSMYHRVRQPNM